ncbi:MAG: ATP-binding protein, partial [Lachnospiraceae bacterium]|nr:ATP-binding protein [Lachnospiraceae bacterium]
FYCADKSHTDKSHFGLGLSIAKELAEFLSADVGVKNTEGGGATFFLTLPLKQDPHPHTKKGANIILN